MTELHVTLMMNDDEHWHLVLAERLAGQHGGEQIWSGWNWEVRLDWITWIFCMKKYSVSFRLSLFLKHKENQRHNATKEFQF